MVRRASDIIIDIYNSDNSKRYKFADELYNHLLNGNMYYYYMNRNNIKILFNIINNDSTSEKLKTKLLESLCILSQTLVDLNLITFPLLESSIVHGSYTSKEYAIWKFVDLYRNPEYKEQVKASGILKSLVNCDLESAMYLKSLIMEDSIKKFFG